MCKRRANQFKDLPGGVWKAEGTVSALGTGDCTDSDRWLAASSWLREGGSSGSVTGVETAAGVDGAI